jgi:hypothetical protein
MSLDSPLFAINLNISSVDLIPCLAIKRSSFPHLIYLSLLPFILPVVTMFSNPPHLMTCQRICDWRLIIQLRSFLFDLTSSKTWRLKWRFENLNTLISVKTRPDADCNSDHVPVICKFWTIIFLMAKRSSGNNRLDLTKLQVDKELKEIYNITIQNR